MECRNGAFLDYRKTIINKAFPSLGRYRSRLDGYLFNTFHTQICNNWADETAHGISMYCMLVRLSFKSEIVVGKNII